MNELHSLLKRQLRRYNAGVLSSQVGENDFLQAVNDAYWQFDADRKMLEHSLELTSKELVERNAELSRTNADLEMRVTARTLELSNSEARFRGLFEHTPVSIWEEDFSGARQFIDDLYSTGVVDFEAYFDAHPEAVAECATRVKIVDVNRATLEIYQAENKQLLLADLSKVFGPESMVPFKGQMLALARGETSFDSETINYTLRGERRVIFLRLTIAPGYEDTWARVFVGINDITELRKAEAALTVERDLLQALMDNIPDTIYFKDAASRFTRINSAQGKVLGIASPQEAIGKTDLDFQPTELSRGFYEEEQRMIETGKPLINRIEFNPKKDGQPRWFSATKVPMQNSQGIVTGIVGISRDITELRLAEAALAENETLFRALFDLSPDAVIVIDPHFPRVSWPIIDCNVAACLMNGYERDELIGRSIDILNVTSGTEAERMNYLNHLREEPYFKIETSHRRKNGEIFPVETSTALIKVGTRELVIGIDRDITDRKRTEDALREAETKYRTLVENMPAIVYIDLADEPHNTIYINPQVQEMLGYSPEDWIAKPDLCNDIIHPEDSERMWKETQESRTRGRYGGDYRYIAKDGHVVWVHDEAVLLKNEGETASLWQGVMLDITAQKAAEEALRRSEERYRLMSWATRDAVWDWDLSAEQIWWGAGLQKIFRYPSETLQTDPGWRRDRIHEDDKTKVDRTIQQALDGGMEFWSKEYRFQRLDGTYADIMDRAYILRDDSGQPYRMLGAMMDITDRKQIEAIIRNQNDMLSSLYQITLDLLKYRDIDALLNAMVDLSAKFLDATFSEIMLMEGEALVVKAAATNQSYLVGRRMGRDDAVLSWQAVDSGRQVVLEDYSHWSLRGAAYNDQNLHAVVAYPIMNDDECLGVLGLGRDKPGYEFTTDQIQFGSLLANLTALILNNAQLREALREQSIHDPLTGLFNRRYMEEVLKQHLSRVTRQHHPLGMIMVDIDHFKEFNDAHGHAAGDAILCEVGRLLQNQIRVEDIACRYGGEEFLLIMPGASIAETWDRAGQLRREVKELQIEHEGRLIGEITLSAGVAVYPEHGSTQDSLMRAADAALYHAKQHGRDQVVLAEHRN